MSYENIGKLVDRWMEDASFRQNLRKDPEGTIRQCKFTLTKEETSMLKSIDWTLSDEVLKSRINLIWG